MSKKPTYEELEQRILKLEKSVLRHQQVEDELEEKESQLHQIIDLVPHCIFVPKLVSGLTYGYFPLSF